MTPCRFRTGMCGLRFLHKLCPGCSVGQVPSRIGISRFFRHTYPFSLMNLNACLCDAAQISGPQISVAKLSATGQDTPSAPPFAAAIPENRTPLWASCPKCGQPPDVVSAYPQNTRKQGRFCDPAPFDPTRSSSGYAGSDSCADPRMPRPGCWTEQRCPQASPLSCRAAHARCLCGSRCMSFHP